MAEDSSSKQRQQLSVSDSASVAGQVGTGQAARDLTQNQGQAGGDLAQGQAARDLLQNQGQGNIFKDVIFQFGAQQTGREAGLSRREYRNRQALLSKVKSYWVKGVLETSLRDRAPLVLNLEDRPDALAHPWDLESATDNTVSRPFAPGTQIIDIFNQLGDGRTLLILGDPGSGKTTALLELARDLLDRAEQDTDCLIPVVFNLSSWAGEKQTIGDWLVAELNTKYQVPEKIGKAWVQEEKLLLLLDGLDEVRADRREACIAALNAFHQTCCPEIVVCSRVQDYTALSNRLTFQGAVYLRSLAPEQVRDYLSQTSRLQASADLADLQALLERDTALQELARSPLMLNTMVMAYQGISLTEMPQMDREERRQHLFNSYIERMLKRRGTDRHYSDRQVVNGLGWLAQQMSQFSQAVFTIEGLQPNWLPSSGQQRLYQIASRILVWSLWGGIHVGLLAGHRTDSTTFAVADGLMGLLLGVLGGVGYGLLGGFTSSWVKGWPGWFVNGAIAALIFGPIFAWIYTPMGGLAYGIIYFLAGLFSYRITHSEVEPVDSLVWSWRKLRNNLGFGLLLGLALFFGGTLQNSRSENQLILSLLFGMLLTLIFGFEKKNEIDRRTLPNQGICNSISNTRKLFLVVGLVTGILLGVADTPVSGVVNGLIFGMLAALIGGQGSGMVCIKHFTLRLLLWFNGCMPWHAARFLNAACDRIFLQKVGGGYVFTHRLLLEHFARLKSHP